MPPTRLTPSIFESVETFAELNAALSDRFADRVAVLAHFRVDETGLHHAGERWSERFRAPDGKQECGLYADAYRRAMKRLHGHAESPDDLSAPAGARFLSSALPFRREAAAVQLMAPDDQDGPGPLAAERHPWPAADPEANDPGASTVQVDTREEPPSADETLVPARVSGASRGDGFPFIRTPIEDVRSSIARMPTGIRSDDESGDTMGLDPNLTPLVPREPPFDGPDDDSLTLDQFAAFQAELSLWPEHARVILERYGLSDETKRRRVTRTWERRFARDHALRADYLSSVNAVRRHLSAFGRG